MKRLFKRRIVPQMTPSFLIKYEEYILGNYTNFTTGELFDPYQ